MKVQHILRNISFVIVKIMINTYGQNEKDTYTPRKKQYKPNILIEMGISLPQFSHL